MGSVSVNVCLPGRASRGHIGPIGRIGSSNRPHEIVGTSNNPSAIDDPLERGGSLLSCLGVAKLPVLLRSAFSRLCATALARRRPETSLFRQSNLCPRFCPVSPKFG